MFMGVGLGIAASGTMVPMLLRQGLGVTWCVLGTAAVLLTATAWRGWPQDASVARPDAPLAPSCARQSAACRLSRRALVFECGLNAAGLVPHMVFLVDFVARGLGRGIMAGAHMWVLYSLGAVCLPSLTGRVADRIGFGRALRMALLLETACVALPAVTAAPGWLDISSFIVGGFTPGIVPLVLGRINELVGTDAAAQRRVWGQATVVFALFQALGAYADSFIFAHMADAYALIFTLGAGATLAAFALDSAVSIWIARSNRPGALESRLTG